MVKMNLFFLSCKTVCLLYTWLTYQRKERHLLLNLLKLNLLIQMSLPFCGLS